MNLCMNRLLTKLLAIVLAPWIFSACTTTLQPDNSQTHQLANTTADTVFPNFRITETVKLPGATRWDYLTLDSAAHRLYLTRGDSVDVFDTVAKRIVGSIAGTKGVHGVALAPALNRGFTSNGGNDTVTVFALDTLKTMATVATDKRPDAIIFDPSTQRIFTANAAGESLTAIDAMTLAPIRNIKLDGKPEFMAVDNNGRLFVNIEPKNQITTVDTAKLDTTVKLDLSAVCDEPAGLSIDIATMRLFAGCHNQRMAIVDGNTGEVLAAPAIGRGSDATVYDDALKTAISSNGEGTLTFIGQAVNGSYLVKQTLATMPGARTMALDSKTHQIYLVAAEYEPATTGADGKPMRPKAKVDSFTLITVGP